MAGTIVVDRLESDASYASSINVASPMVISNTITMGSSAAISGNVNFDSGTLFVDSVGNEVGIGTQSPLAKLDIRGDTTTYAGMAKIYLTDSNSNSSSRNWSIGNGGSAHGNLTLSVSAAKDGNAGDGTSVVAAYWDPSGRMTKPLQPYAAVGRNAGNISGGNVLIFNSVAQNIGSVYNSTTGRFTAPITGRYIFSFVTLQVGSSEFWARARVNGSAVALSSYTQGVTAGYTQQSASAVFALTANDYVDLYIDRGTSYGGDTSQCNAYFYFLG